MNLPPYNRIDRRTGRAILTIRPFEYSTAVQLISLRHETGNLHSAFAQLQRRVDLLDQERIDLLHRMEEITQELQNREALRHTQASATRLDNFPIDILRSIFLKCLPEDGDAIMDANDAPLSLGQVCSSWRNVAWSSPELWDTLCINFPALEYNPLRFERSKWEAYLAAIGDWLERSKGRPLSISILDQNVIIWSPYSDPREELLKKVLQRVSSESFRWRSLRLHITANVMNNYLPIDPSNAQLLEIFEFHNSNLDFNMAATDAPDVDPATFHPIILSPNLHSLDSSDASLFIRNEPNPQLNLTHCKWHRLVNLCIGNDHPRYKNNLTPPQALSILTHLATLDTPLKSCRMVLALEEDSIDIDGLKPIMLKALQELTIVCSSSRQTVDNPLKSFFSLLQLPLLNSFEYETFTPSYFPFFGLIQQASPTLKVGLFVPNCPPLKYIPVNSDMLTFFRSENIRNCIMELHLSVGLSSLLAGGWLGKVAFPNLEILKLDCSLPKSREIIYEEYNNGDSDTPVIIKPTWDLNLRATFERKRYRDLEEKISLIGTLSISNRGGRISRTRLREVDFRLNERLQKKALGVLAPLITEGLHVTFSDDYYDLPPP